MTTDKELKLKIQGRKAFMVLFDVIMICGLIALIPGILLAICVALDIPGLKTGVELTIGRAVGYGLPISVAGYALVKYHRKLWGEDCQKGLTLT